MTTRPPTTTIEEVTANRPRGPAVTGRRLAVGAGVALAHMGLFVMLAMTQASPSPYTASVIDIQLVPPVVVPPPPVPKPVPPSPRAGGGAPAAPSRVHTPPTPKPVIPELPAPIAQAPKPEIVVGAADVATPTPGPGQGGEGRGIGTGVGDGDGPGSGGTPPMIIRRATPAEILSVVPQAARRARQAGRAAVNCVIRVDQQLDDCRIVDQNPPGFEFGQAALNATRFFRYRPPMTASGRPIEGQRVTVFVLFGRQ